MPRQTLIGMRDYCQYYLHVSSESVLEFFLQAEKSSHYLRCKIVDQARSIFFLLNEESVDASDLKCISILSFI